MSVTVTIEFPNLEEADQTHTLSEMDYMDSPRDAIEALLPESLRTDPDVDSEPKWVIKSVSGWGLVG